LEALGVEKYTDPCWGEVERYFYVDYDSDQSEVYCFDCAEDWKLYGFSYSMNGDHVVINFDSKKRKKFSIVDFDEGSPDFDYKYALDHFGKTILTSQCVEFSRIKSELEEKYHVASQTIENMQFEINNLKEYQKSKMNDERKSAENELFARFADLDGVEAFEHLRSNCTDMTLEDVESKCFEIRGRHTSLNFSATKPKATRIVVERNQFGDEPYGGLFIEYPPKRN
jgi:FtsZ-binding cell division protein ZapB